VLGQDGQEVGVRLSRCRDR